jgi:hypothetical protein
LALAALKLRGRLGLILLKLSYALFVQFFLEALRPSAKALLPSGRLRYTFNETSRYDRREYRGNKGNARQAVHRFLQQSTFV